MSSILLALAFISASVALSGFIWSTAVGLRSRKEASLAAEKAQTGAVSGADVATDADAASVAPVAGASSTTPIDFSFTATGRQVRETGWRAALPGLLMAAGMLSVLVFGGLALLVSLPSRLFGIAALAIAVYVAVTELRSICRALRE
jgi:hypothetical protein